MGDRFIKIDPSELVPWAHVKIHNASEFQSYGMSDMLAYCSNPGQARSRKSISTYNIYINGTKLKSLVNSTPSLAKIGERNIYVALLLHEIGHIRYGSFTTSMRNLSQVQFWIFNLLEDMRIEYHMGYDFTNLAPFIRLLNTITKSSVEDEITIKAGLYYSERELVINMLNALYDFVRFGLLPNDEEERKFVNFAFPFVLTAERGGVSDAINSAVAIATKLDGMLMDISFAASREMFMENFASTSKSDAGAFLYPLEDEELPSEDMAFFEQYEKELLVPDESIDIGAGFEDHNGSFVYDPIKGSPDIKSGRPNNGEEELDDMFENYADEYEEDEDSTVDNEKLNKKLIEYQIDMGKGEQHPLYDVRAKRTPTPSIAPKTLRGEDDFEKLADSLNEQSENGSSFVDEIRKDFLDDLKEVEPGKTVVRLPGMTNSDWENSLQSRDLSGGSGSDVQVMIVGESNESFFYRSTVDERIDVVSRMRRTMREMFRETTINESFDGELNPMRQQEAYLASITGDDGKDYTTRKLTGKSCDVAILRDISGSTYAVKREYAEAIVIFLEALEGIENVQTGLIDFESNFVVTKRFEEPLRCSRIYPVSRGGTQIDGSLDEIKKWNWKGSERLCVIITDGGLASRHMERHLRELEEKNIKAVVLGLGYTAPLQGIPLFMTTVADLPDTMGGLVKNYILRGILNPVEVESK